MKPIWDIAKKDLQIELRSSILLIQVLPFALVVLVLFGMALDADTATLRAATPGLFWVTVLFASIMVIERSVAIETDSNTFDALRLSGLSGWKLFLGKALAVGCQILVIEAVLLIGVVVLFRAEFGQILLTATASLAATSAIASAGSLYGVISVGLGGRSTILPLLLLPVLTPVLVAASRVFGSALGTLAVDGWVWTSLLALAAVFYLLAGALAYETVLEDA